MTRIEQILARAARLSPDRIAVRDEGREVSWSELQREGEAVARRLVAEGIRARDRVIVLGRNRIETITALYGCARISAVAVLLNTRLLPAEIAELAARSTARVALIDERLAGLASALPERVTRVSMPLGESPDLELPRPSLDASCVLVQMYTSGTTGKPKGAMLTHAQMSAMTLSWQLEVGLRGPEDTFLQVTPLYHIGAVLMALTCAVSRARMVLAPEFSPGLVARLLRDEGVTHTLLVPAMIRWLLDDPGCEGISFPSLRMLVYGAAPIPSRDLARAQARFGCDLLQGYGLTETGGVLTALRPEDHLGEGARLQSAGRPVLGVEITLVDRDGKPAPKGAVGEVAARGPNVFLGYHDMPEETKSSFTDGLFRTGDLGVIDEDGFLTITDRSKDMILVGGENVYPREIEEVLLGHPVVSEVAVIGVPHETWGESVLAVVVPRAPLPEEEQPDTERSIVSFARERLARFKCPTRVTFAGSLPRNAAGKLMKGSLRAPYWEGRERSV